MTHCVGIRGATTVDEDSLEEILDATMDLLQRLQELNGFTPDEIGSAIFTTTPDLHATFPARAARRLGWTQVPMLCAQEIDAPSAIQRCVRVMLQWNTDTPLRDVRHAYLRKSRMLRPDWAIPPLVGPGGSVTAPERPHIEVEGAKTLGVAPAPDSVVAAPAGRPAPFGPIDFAPVAVQGEPGSYTQQALFATFGRDTECITTHAFAEAFEAVNTGRAKSALMPVENSTTGSIHQVYDLLLTNDLTILAEVFLPVQHTLMATRGTTIGDITEVLSHPQALLQCDAWITSHRWTPRAVSNTAGGARMVAEAGQSNLAAIGSLVAAELHGLEILAHDIQDVSANFTRFLLLMPRHAAQTGAFVAGAPYEGADTPVKTSLIFATRHVAGDLYGCLAEFAVREINLTKIESRPDKRTPWNYLFYLDFDGHAHDPVIASALKSLERHATFIRVLGSYPSRHL
ncbi:MAG: prephenate dehydratase [Myxococcota bacterium]|jgi:prephenate dehydratase